MHELTASERALAIQLDNRTLTDLYNLLGKAAAESQDANVRDRYVLGTPDLFDRGARVVKDARTAICSSRERLEGLAIKYHEELEVAEWASVVVDVIASTTVTAGIPPIAVAVACGKLCNRTLSKLCP